MTTDMKLIVKGFDEFGDFKTETLLVKGYQRICAGWVDTRALYGTTDWRIVSEISFVPSKPHIWVPKLTLPQAVAAGAAAAIITNPEITRRFWAGWKL